MLKRLTLILLTSGALLSCNAPEGGSEDSEGLLAERPPMGWNSWICFGTSVTEAEVKANADFMAEHLKQYGWEYIVIDAGWYAPGMVNIGQYESDHPEQLIDDYGRLRVDEAKFPSAAGGKGLKPLADYIHSKGLKLGIHIMRGIPVQAVETDCPVKGSVATAADIADTDSRCDWYHGFYGIDMTKPGAQEYYDSLVELYTSWEIDYIKADDMLSPVYAVDEIDALSEALSKSGRDIVLSLSPGPAPVENVRHLRKSGQLWRISEDFWDNWESLKKQFEICRRWQDYVRPGSWPDADMLPIGPMAQRAMRGKPRSSNFTEDEQMSMMSLWAMFRSPLMIGCNMPEMDEFTLSLLTNEDLIKINQTSTGNRELYSENGIIVWYAHDSGCTEFYVAVFNTNDEPVGNYEFPLSRINLLGNARCKDLWSGSENVIDDGCADFPINAHGVRLLKLSY